MSLTIQLSVKLADGTPAAGENVTVMFNDRQRQNRFTKTLVSDQHGLVTFTLPPIDIETKTLTLQVSLHDLHTAGQSASLVHRYCCMHEYIVHVNCVYLICLFRACASQASLPDHDYTPSDHHYTPQETRASHYLKQWYSPSNSYVQIQPLDGAVVAGRDVIFNVSQTIEDSGVYTLHYQVRV